jgi:hypothetical protein
MTALHITVEQKKTVKIQLSVLAREDATDAELKWARSIEDALLAVFKSLPEALAPKVTRDEEGDGHDRIRGKK